MWKYGKSLSKKRLLPLQIQFMHGVLFKKIARHRENSITFVGVTFVEIAFEGGHKTTLTRR
jgi:hypothetical protein